MPELSIVLLQEAVRGSRRAVRELVDLLLPMVHYRVARTLLRSRRHLRPDHDVRRETQDLIRSVLLFLFSNGARALLRWSPDHGMSLRSYAGDLAEREASSILRSRHRAVSWNEAPPGEDLPDEPCESSPSPGGRELPPGLLGRIESSLSGRDLELFHLIVLEQRSPEEICTLVDMTPEAVSAARSRLARVARGLAAEVAAAWDQPITGRG